MTDPGAIGTHAEPVWRDRANFIIRAPIPDAVRARIRIEQLWARQLDELTFELCCIPFWLYDVALGDTVRTDVAHEVVEVVQRRGHATYRVWLRDQPVDRDELVAALTERGALLEWAGHDLLAIDAADAEMSRTLADYLWAEEQRGALVYETGDLVPR